MTTPDIPALVKALRKEGEWVSAFDEFDPPRQWVPNRKAARAADALEALTAENEKLREALAWIAGRPGDEWAASFAADALATEGDG